MRVFASLLALVLLSACATTSGGSGLSERDPADPYEGFNRGVWNFNQAVDKAALKPVSTVYRTVTPRPARRGLSRVIQNLTEPWSFINNLLQGKPDRAFQNLGRFVVNTTIGVGGLADHATGLGIKPANEDFGQTLATWGAKDSPYLVLPLLGPSTIRDGIGSGVGFFADPYRICLDRCTGLSSTEQLGITAFTFISVRSDLTDAGADALLESSLDPYATARSAFLQRRKAMILDQEGDASEALPLDDGVIGGANDPALDAAVKELESQDTESPATPAETPPPLP